MENQAIIASMSENAVFSKPQLLYQKAFIEAVAELQATQHDRYYVEKVWI